MDLQSGKIFPDKVHSEHSHQNSLDLEVAELKRSSELVDMLVRNYIEDHPLVAHYLALQSVQELR